MACSSFHLKYGLEGDDKMVTGAETFAAPQKIDLCLDLSYHNLLAFPLSEGSISPELQFLYLQGNNIDRLPKDFFCCFPFLRHLDLRQNQLKEIPASIAGHNCLEVLLLQDNHLKSLPFELGQAPRLRKLQVSGNPISWPPKTVLSSGLGAILSFLRNAYMRQLRREDMDAIPKANEYECTKEEEDSDQQLSDTVSQDVEEEQSSSTTKIQTSCHQNNKEKRMQKQNSKDSRLIYLKGSPKQLRHRNSSTVNSTHSKAQKCPSLQPYVTPDHALAIMKGQPFPLGYKKRTGLSTTKIYKTLLQQLWLNQLKCVLQSQDHALQKQKNSEVLRQWRQDARALQQSSSQPNWSGLEFPYDMDSNYLKMVTRSNWQLFQNESLEKRGHSKPNVSCVRAMGLQEKINQILQSFDEMKTSNLVNLHSNSIDTDPSTRCKLLAEEMKKISKLQKAVQALRLSSE